jgi:pimeloyl-ACP methyl ester carboxylesterase
VLEVIKRHGGGRAVLVGHSLGVDVILEAWRQSSADVAAMVLIEGGLVASGDPDLAVSHLRQRIEAVGLNTFLNASFSQMFVPTSDPHLRQRVLQRLAHLDAHFAREIVLSKVYWDASLAPQVLASVSVPVMLVQSTYFDAAFQRYSLEPGMSTPWTELVAQQVPDVRLRFVYGVGHFTHVEAPQIVNEHIAGFASACGPPE